ncbi:MarR family winged helix-turn-helix transcriptional regulator [Staphylococcus simiae]|uniref:MarR family transcriptional regulator n=1 Tax=Staphylococcus simiae CCM 7213 = CCUG 51256 TaxID=911238 RepID=G5JFR6_9STAP|nr:MarR family transcriptional regulator [Staphylococcus simiae]EHJ08969.1 MarR family transcriptional regulator [Staphylococcus simiae CCM 7213 = CCUG 51256]PNZ10519.1 MarR family transcriptional regulator [Staphylococcus simiae]SNV74667.1 putative MarR family transcriptional regulator [Staphylococcus simiae]
MNKEQQLMSQLREIFNKIAYLNKDRMEEALKGYKSSEIHCLEAIEEIEAPNVTKLTRALYMTRGAISKLTKRLIAKGLIETYQSQDNKKEIYFKLTPAGKDVYQLHEQLHQEFEERDRDVFNQMTEDEYRHMMTFIEKYNHHLDKEIIEKENIKK